jgi:hypothetical protein
MTPLPGPVSMLLRTSAAAAMAALLLISGSHRDLFAWATEAIGGEERATLPPKANHAARRTPKANAAALNPTFGGPLTIYTTHSGLAKNVTTPTEAWMVQQQGFYAPGDGGDATYQWNFTSYCPGGTSGSPTIADGFVCVLPIGQPASSPGRYLQSLTNGVLNAKTIGFRDDGIDNAPMVYTLNTILNRYIGMPVNFPADPAYQQANYWFSQPLEILNSASISCGDGARQMQFPGVNLVFGPDVSGVRFEGYGLPGFAGGGIYAANFSGCGVENVGFTRSGATASVAGKATIPNTRISTPSAIASGAIHAEPTPALGDGVALFNSNGYWDFSGSIVGNVLTVTAWSSGWSATDPGIAVGQMLRGSGVPYGVFIRYTHAENSIYTGTGQLGTYEIYPSIANPTFSSQANSGTLTGNFNTEVQSGPPLVAPGTTVVGCSNLSGSNCPFAGWQTLTLSNAPRLGLPYAQWLLPGPNTSYPYGSQMYNVTTSLTGRTYGPFTVEYSNGSGGPGYVLNVTGGPGGLNLGQVVMWAHSGATPVTTTTTSPLTIGEYTSIPVRSCTGITSGMFVIGTASGNAVFPPGTTVDTCTGTSLSVALQEGGPAATSVVSGSNIASIYSYYYPPYSLWTGLPITGTHIPANTTISGPVVSECCPGGFNVPMSNKATGTTSFPGQSLSFGGATYAASSGTTLAFLNGAANIISLGSGTGANGTYRLDSLGYLAPGSTVYTYDTPATIYVTDGPRMIQPQDLIWSDAFPFGTVAAKIYGTSPTRQTVMTAITNSYGAVSAQVAHSVGSGKMWMLPDGVARNVAGSSYGNLVEGFGIGLNMACAANNNYPVTGCGRSSDSNNLFQFNLVGRMDAGNNAGGFSSIYNEYDHNFVADIAELATIGGVYIGEMLQGEDESSNTHDMVSGCLTNNSSFTGVYASGSDWELSCYVGKDQMIGDQPALGLQFYWYGSIYSTPADAIQVNGTSIGTTASCNGTPTSSFKVVAGRVTHC